jgi:hypothetical protein
MIDPALGREFGEPTAGRRVWLAIVAPLVVVDVAYLLWAVSDRLLYVGPLDRATFGWLVVVPVWLAAPIAAAIGRVALIRVSAD